ncbi:uncharacterized protein LOC135170278 [Diachasmimorpha longicaudata]|uniref:uncharacterized protein LOC135170278 n=1 Tax=Diachasmimorpha longicaudata TaxID=58733 RepID=UPI0030B8A768
MAVVQGFSGSLLLVHNLLMTHPEIDREFVACCFLKEIIILGGFLIIHGFNADSADSNDNCEIPSYCVLLFHSGLTQFSDQTTDKSYHNQYGQSKCPVPAGQKVCLDSSRRNADDFREISQMENRLKVFTRAAGCVL